MKIEDCTKEELIQFIKSTGIDQRELEFQVLMGRAVKASGLSHNERRKSIEALKEYTEALKPYEGCTYMDIPDAVTLKAVAAFKRYEKHMAISHRYDNQYKSIQKQIDKLL